MVTCVIAIVLIVLVLIYVTVKKKTAKIVTSLFEVSGIPQIEKSIVSLTDIVSFFKEPSRLEQLQADKDKIAVAIKEKTDSGSIILVLCIFSKSSNTIVEPCMKIIASELSPDLLSMFGTKDMLVLQ